MPDTVTVTAKTGPGLAVTALPITNATGLEFDFAKEVLTVRHNSTYKEFDLRTVATATFVIAGTEYTVTIST